MRRVAKWLGIVGVAAALHTVGVFLWSQDRTVEPPLPQLATGLVPEAVPDGAMRSMEIRILTYNVEGLPWPVRYGRAADLTRIGAELAALRERGEAPHIVLLQEAFTGQAASIAQRSGYPNFIRGPRVFDRFDRVEPLEDDHPLLHPIRSRGERVGKFVNAGLYILSEFPILAKESRPFSAAACAGFDCMSNKGVLFARLQIPGMPEALEVATTHLNAQGASRVPRDRTHSAHRQQVEELAVALEGWRENGNPFIIGGDFNVRRAPARFEFAEARKGLDFVRPWCARQAECVREVPWESETPWLKTQDLQAFGDGAKVTVRPLHLALMFDGRNGPIVSDHAGYQVTYRLSWPAGTEVAKAAPPAALAPPLPPPHTHR